MVATDSPLATGVGVEILKKGGNAIDASVGIAFALAVVLPEAGNIGGGGFIVAALADGSTAALDFREKAPFAATARMYLDSAAQLTDRSVDGHLASGIPGSIAGLWEAHRRYGTLPWSDLLAPAIRLAEEGFVVGEELEASIRSNSSRFSRYPGSAELFLPRGEVLKAGTVWRNPDLGCTLRRVAELGPPGFYEGETADLIVAEMKRGGGIITHADLEVYRPVWREPVTFVYRGHRVVSMPPPSSGGATLAMIANILEGYDLRGLGWHSPLSLHLTVEAMRRAFADRNHWLADPDFVDLPLETLVSKSYAARRRSGIRPGEATPSSQLGPGGAHEGSHTTHFSVVDSAGNAVALTTTINLEFGCGVIVKGAGFLLNNEMDDFAALPGAPNSFGLVQGEANSIAPEKRVLSSMTPTIVLDHTNRPLLITGASGGPRIITAVFQVLSNVLDFGLELPAAVSAPRIHHQHLPDEILTERAGVPDDVREGLLARGHHVHDVAGLAVAASVLRRDGVWQGAADPRRSGAANGY
jgi:gamma-glutamyltranspeptidase/glutathione hydrolase